MKRIAAALILVLAGCAKEAPQASAPASENEIAKTFERGPLRAWSSSPGRTVAGAPDRSANCWLSPESGRTSKTAANAALAATAVAASGRRQRHQAGAHRAGRLQPDGSSRRLTLVRPRC